MIISTFDSATSNNPRQGEATWEQLARGFLDVRECPCTLADCGVLEIDHTCRHKDGPSWSPAHYAPGTFRSRDGVLSVCALVVDLDHLSPEKLPGYLERLAPYRRIVHASHSDRPHDRCLRAVLAISRPVTGPEWPRFWRFCMTELLQLPADEHAKDASRLYYLPSRPSDGADPEAFDGSGYAHEVADGVVIDVDAVLEVAPPEADDGGSNPGVIPDFAGAPDDDKMLAAIEVLAAAWPETGIHGAQLALSGALARAGWPVELIAQFVASVCELHRPGNAKLEKRMIAARTSVEKVRAGESVQGWPSVEAALGARGAAAVASACSALGVGGAIPAHDQSFVDAMNACPPLPRAVMPVVAPTRGALEAAITAESKNRRQGGESENARRLMKLVRVGATLDLEDREKDLAEAIKIVVRVAPPGTTREQIARAIMGLSPGADSSLLIEHAMQRARAGDEGVAGSPEDFAIDAKTGRPFPNSQHNLDLAMQKLDVRLRFNQFTRKMLLCRDGERDVIVEDHHVIALRYAIDAQFHFAPAKDELFDFVTDRARRDSFHPVVDYLEEHEPTWDGVPRIDTWLIALAGAKDTPYVRAVSRLILVAACRRVRHPGCKFDEMLVLESPVQGTGKSSALAALCPDDDWFTDKMPFDGNLQRQMEAIAGKWIIEAGEMAGKKRVDPDTLKNFMSSQRDEGRAAYGRLTDCRLRECIFIGSTNNARYLRDTTGNRRYWPVLVKEFDAEGLRTIRDQLWAEAAAAESAGESIRLARHLWAEASEEQRQREVEDPLEDRLEPLLADRAGKIRKTDVWRIVGHDRTVVGQRDPSQPEVSRITDVMQRMGWVYHRQHRFSGTAGEGERLPAYVRGDNADARGVELRLLGSVVQGWSVVPATQNDDTVKTPPQGRLVSVPPIK